MTQKLYWWGGMLLVAVAVYTATMLLSIGNSIWFDEGYSILLAKSSWQELFALTAVDAHPPLFYALLKAWGSLFGFSEFALRSLSAVMAAGAVVAMATLLRKMFSTRVALSALPLIVAAPFVLRYGYEVRMYSMALLIAVGATYALLNAYKGNKWSQWLVYGVLVALGMYTLYMTIVVWVAHAIWLLVQSLKTSRQPILQWRWVYAFIGAIALFAPYIPTFIHQMFNSVLPGIGKSLTLTSLVDIVTVLFTFTPEWQVGGWLSLLLFAGIALTVWVGVSTYRNYSKQDKRSYGFLLFLVFVPLAFYALTSLPPRDPIFVNRYLAHVALFVYALVAVTLALGVTYRDKLAKNRRLVPIVAYAVVTAIAIIGVSRLYSAGNFVFERMQTPQTQQVRNSIECNDETTIVADDPYTYIDSVFYFDGCDMKFYSKESVEKKGGYAPLHDSVSRVGGSTDVNTSTLIRLGWNGAQASFAVDDRYTLIDSRVYDKQLVEVYALNAE